MIIYEFLYNGCIHESSCATISLHRTREGAEKAMNEHKQKSLERFNKMIESIEDDEYRKEFIFGEHEDWCIGETELLD